MIDLRGVWLPQIIGYAELIADESVLRASWFEHDRSRTSVTDFDELYEQIFGGLDVEDQLGLAVDEFHDDPEIVRLVSGFIDALRKLDQIVVKSGINHQPERILASAEWFAVRERANELDVYAVRRKYRSDLTDNKPTVVSIR
ncbi:hypothetical protein [Methylopila sp. M107]|uniref:hypothetical protein n=1 Tax=Methylopila sp. M107 TaxID=1101190 RepID=UPI0012DCEA14|nr:hypothetical protein [Methylopila sp. M107]